MRFQTFILCMFLCILTAGCSTAGSSKDNKNNKAVTIQNKGSDTIVNLALAWAEEYQKIHPEVEVSVTGGGTGTGFASLFNNTIDIANASRAISSDEEKTAAQNNIKPVASKIARDAIGVIVNKNNPVKELTIDQISKIYSGVYTNWKEVGGEDRPIVRLSRETNSGTHVYFLETVVRKGNKKDKTLFSRDTLLLPSSEGIITEVRDNPNAIGYDGLGYITDEVRTIAVAKEAGKPYILPSIKTVNDGSYPVSRDLFMYTRGDPQGDIKQYLDWIKSDTGQAIVQQLGFVPLLK